MTRSDAAQTAVDLRVREAYEAMGPDDAARARVLAALRSHAAEADKTARPASRRPRAALKWLLPLAACLVLVAVVVAVGLPAGDRTFAASESESAYEAVAADEAAYEDGVTAASQSEKGEALAPETNKSASGVALWRLCPYVELSSGEERMAGKVVGEDEAPDDSRATPAIARSEDGTQTCACDVADDAYVRYADEDVWRVLE